MHPRGLGFVQARTKQLIHTYTSMLACMQVVVKVLDHAQVSAWDQASGLPLQALVQGHPAVRHPHIVHTHAWCLVTQQVGALVTVVYYVDLKVKPHRSPHTMT